MNTYRGSIVALLAAAFAGCGGGTGGSSTPDPVPPTPPPPPPVVDALPGGHWFGTVTDEFNAVTQEFVALVDENGRFRFVSADTAVQMSGNFAVVGNDVTGEGTAFADASVFWLDATSATLVTIEATLVERSELSGTWTTVAGEFGSFEFFYDPTFYERVSRSSPTCSCRTTS